MAKKRHNWPRIILQWGTLAALFFFLSGLAVKIFPNQQPADPEALCPVGGLQALSTFFVRGSLPCSMSSAQILMGIALAAAVILFSKLFCAYLCPVGTVEDFLTRVRKALNIRTEGPKAGSVGDKALRIVKYVLLFYVFYMTIGASELFCKKLDPYYAVATGFKGEIVLWMSITTVTLVIAGGLFIKRFWCRYICPLGAASNTLKFWLPLLGLGLLWWVLALCGVKLAWWWLLAAVCLLGYLFEILRGESHLQTLYVIKDDAACTRCGLCNKACPYAIDVAGRSGKITSVDCTLCGECVNACNLNVLGIGSCAKKAPGRKWMRWLPAIIAVVLVAAGLVLRSSFELPTIDEKWDVPEGVTLSTVKIENLKSVKCYGSSMAFKARMEKVRGVHGVKTYVGSHTVVISYDPSKTTAEKIQEEVFVPSHFRVWSPDPEKLKELKILTIRTEKMYDKLDLNYLGLQFRQTGRGIFGVESEYNCPLIVHVYVSPNEEFDEAWFKEIVNKKVLQMPVHGGGVKETPVDFEFVRMEKGESYIGIDEYLHRMFDPFSAEFSGRYPQGDSTVVRKRTEVYEGKPQFIYEIADQNYEKPIIKRGLPFLSNHLSKEEGVIGVYLTLNKALKPCIQVRFAAPMTADRIWELMTMPKWTITYKVDDVREEDPRLKFDEPGICYPYEK